MIFFEKFLDNNISNSLDLIDRLVEKVAENTDYSIGDKIKNVHNTIKTVRNPIESVSEILIEISDPKLSFTNEEPEIGDHIYVNRLFYTHHGIYVGDGQVIHYTGTPDNIEDATIQEDSLETFLDGGTLRIKKHAFPKYKDFDVVCRAGSRLGEKGYNLFNNNCQNFAEWCINGSSYY